ncbi:UDP-N-acetylmuramoyl-L-alanine--D-glutamate ligase [Clostridium sp. KNHs216]|uniref:UDP-N-acetylmuramoyl-L-alanine--D-glutamate ligase n=1 Tax=Clostridium sp. KNHs216 TaxID=1550235 RepID=UPI00114F515F|nr:UDP-N-acetylmuramoyl-L-alanine--D-glutamate ligase [Clostridium sp. KNHs216]TQI67395.1 UDP-N-acetylmuramoylalanine--D-glutamate ligase [Clostridium sp. KNHs216]
MDIQKFYSSIQGKRVAFCGIGGSNLPLIKIFAQRGAAVTARDRRTEEKLGETAGELKALGVTLRLGEGYLENLDEDIIFRTPGMKYYLPELNAARERGSAVTSEMEVFFDLCPCKIFAVTGSDGKTTTTTILSEMLKAAGKTVHLGGNIGNPLLPEIESIHPDDVAVVELSSFQLISMRRSPDVAVVTNVTPNHLDMHKDMQEYIDAKKNILLHQNAFGRAVLNADYEITAGFAKDVRGDRLMFSRRGRCARGAWLNDQNEIILSLDGKDIPVMSASEIRIPGGHNIENYLAAVCALWGTVGADAMVQTARTFSGVEHRNEFVRELDGVKYYNDSIGTTPSRTANGTLKLFDRKILLIAGGYDKKIPFDSFGPAVVDSVKTLVLMGATADKIEQSVKASPNYREGGPKIIRVQSLEEAVEACRAEAVPGDIVSLSPACASFDMFPNYETRGEEFKKLVERL